MASDLQHIFIIGAPRSGTTWLQIMMGAHPLICTTVEFTLFNKYIAPWIDAWKRGTTNIVERGLSRDLPFLWTEEEFYEFLEGFLDKAYQKVVEKKPQARYIPDKQPNYSIDLLEYIGSSLFEWVGQTFLSVDPPKADTVPITGYKKSIPLRASELLET